MQRPTRQVALNFIKEYLNKAGLTICGLACDDATGRKPEFRITLNADLIMVVAIPAHIHPETSLEECRVVIIIADGVAVDFPLPGVKVTLLDMPNAAVALRRFFKCKGRDVPIEKIIAAQMSFAREGSPKVSLRERAVIFNIRIALIRAESQGAKGQAAGKCD